MLCGSKLNNASPMYKVMLIFSKSMLVKFYVHSCICWWPATTNKDEIYDGETLLSPCIITSEKQPIKNL